MAQQSFRYLKKIFKRIYKPENDKKDYTIFNYLREAKNLVGTQCPVTSAETFTCLHQVDQILKVCTAATVAEVMAKIAKNRVSSKEKTNFLYANEIINSSLCHMKYVAFQYFRTGLESIPDERLRVHLRNLCALCGLCYTQECMAAGYDAGFLKRGDNSLIQEAINQLLLKIRPQAIPLVELFGLSDHILTSAVGNSYGDIYEQHLEWAQASRLN